MLMSSSGGSGKHVDCSLSGVVAERRAACVDGAGTGECVKGMSV